MARRVEALGGGNAVYDAPVLLTEVEARAAFNQLSGEAHVSAGNALMANATLIGGIPTDRLEPHPDRDSGAPAGQRFWTRFYGTVGVKPDDPGMAASASSAGGVVVGLDGTLDDWQVGMMVHPGTTATTVAARDSVSGGMEYGLGVYGGRQWGDTRLSLGAVYAAGTVQVNAQLSHRFDAGVMAFTPFAGLSYVNHASDGFSETGGAAALSGSARIADATLATLGVTVDRQFVFSGDLLLTATASPGWRHAIGGPNGDVAISATPVRWRSTRTDSSHWRPKAFTWTARF